MYKTIEVPSILKDILINDEHDWTSCDYGKKDGTREIGDSRISLKINYPWTLLVDMKKFSNMFNLEDVEFKDNEILKYGTGGHFEEHTDRMRGEKHIGTLLLIYSRALEGGELIIENKVYDVNINNLFYLPLDILHQVN